MVAFTQCVLQFFIIRPIFKSDTVLDDVLFPLFVLDTLIIAAGGYVINDIMDQDIDMINKPEKTFIGTYIPKTYAWIYYFIIVIGGFLISSFIALRSDNVKFLWIYPVATLILYYYAIKLKSSILWGNIVVSGFVAFVWAILFIAQFSASSHLQTASGNHFIVEICLAYATFAFFINMIREIIKDVEDIAGDLRGGIKTLPIEYGVATSKRAAIFCILILSVLILLWVLTSTVTSHVETKMYFLLIILAPLLSLLVKIKTAETSQHYARISKIVKIIMFAGLCSAFIIARYNFS
jgi:4-hydroxybenzoate polyprenyltransferase